MVVTYTLCCIYIGMFASDLLVTLVVSLSSDFFITTTWPLEADHGSSG